MPVRSKQSETVARVLWYTGLTMIGATMLVPFVWMLSTSLKAGGAFVVHESWWKDWIPGETVTYVEQHGRRVPVRKILAKDGVARVKITEKGAREGEEISVPEGDVRSEWRVRCQWANYARAWQSVGLARAYVNSLLVALCITFGQVLTSSLAAYAFARMNFFGRDKIFLGYLATMMIPGAVTMIPVYILVARGPGALDQMLHTDIFTSTYYFFGAYAGRPLGLDSYFAIVAPGLFSAYGTFMLRQFFLSLPKDLEDAARIDGCGHLRIWWHVILPLSRPALATLTIFTFMGSWKSFMWPLIVAQAKEMQTLPVALANFQGLYSTEYELLMSGSMMVLLPIIIVFLLAQRHFVSGIRLGAVKG